MTVFVCLEFPADCFFFRFKRIIENSKALCKKRYEEPIVRLYELYCAHANSRDMMKYLGPLYTPEYMLYHEIVQNRQFHTFLVFLRWYFVDNKFKDWLVKPNLPKSWRKHLWKDQIFDLEYYKSGDELWIDHEQVGFNDCVYLANRKYTIQFMKKYGYYDAFDASYISIRCKISVFKQHFKEFNVDNFDELFLLYEAMYHNRPRYLKFFKHLPKSVLTKLNKRLMT